MGGWGCFKTGTSLPVAEVNSAKWPRPSPFNFNNQQGESTFVNKKAKAILKTYLNANLSVIRSDYLFTTQKSKQFTANTLTQLLKRLYEQVGFKNCSGYSGRRTFITKLANSGVNVRVIAELASHKSIQTTQRYIEINDNLCSNAVELV